MQHLNLDNLHSLGGLAMWLLSVVILPLWILTQRPSATGAVGRMLDALGMARLPRAVSLGLVTLWAALAAAMLAGLIWGLIQILSLASGSQGANVVRNQFFMLAALTTISGALVTLPITLVKTRQSSRQTKTAEIGLINDKISQAGAQLSAKLGEEDDVVARMLAIDRLGRIAEETPQAAYDIATLLAAYIRVQSRLCVRKEEEGPVRIDIESAAQTLAGLDRFLREREDLLIDLRGADLSGCDLRYIEVRGWFLWGASLARANLVRAKLDSIRCLNTKLTQCLLYECTLTRSRFFEIDFSTTRDIHTASFKNNLFWDMNLSVLGLPSKKLAENFGSKNCTLADGVDHPVSWLCRSCKVSRTTHEHKRWLAEGPNYRPPHRRAPLPIAPPIGHDHPKPKETDHA